MVSRVRDLVNIERKWPRCGARRAGRFRSARRATNEKISMQVCNEATIRRIQRCAEGFFSTCCGRSVGALIAETIENREKTKWNEREAQKRARGKETDEAPQSEAEGRTVVARAFGRFVALAEKRSPKKICALR